MDAPDVEDQLIVATDDAADPKVAPPDAGMLVGTSDETSEDVPAFYDEASAALEHFDAPGEDALTTEVPPEAHALDGAADDPEEVPEPTIDRAAAVRELAGLFSDEDRPRPQRAAASGGEPAAEPQRLEDDDQITKGLISRLIDGVKGL
jgi:hypothetical protein